MSLFKRLCYSSLAAVAAWQITAPTNAAILGPYGPYGVDANTAHLWHIDETSLNVADAIAGGNNRPMTSLGSVGNATNNLGATSYPGFGTAYKGPNTFGTANVGLSALTPGVVAADSLIDDVPMASFFGANGAFTFECITRIDFDPASIADTNGLALISAENDVSNTTAQRLFYFGLEKTAGNWHAMFYGYDQGATTLSNQVNSANLGIQQGHWYHVAVSYNGLENTAGNLKYYWTDMGTDAVPDSSATVANQIGIVGADDRLPFDLGTLTADFAIGSQARRSGTSGLRGSFQGLIDEVRISTVERAAGDFIFVPEPSTYLLAGVGLLTMVCAQARRHRASLGKI